jgi:hypothetical protein
MMKNNIGVMHLQTKEYQALLATIRARSTEREREREREREKREREKSLWVI